MKVDFLVVGAGLTGATLAERIASVLDRRVLVVEKKIHVAGHAYDEYEGSGVLVHRYGPHIFHTNSPEVFQYLSKFTRWRPYEHRVLAVVDGQELPLPFNLRSLRLVFSPRVADRIEDTLVRKFGLGARLTILQLRQENDPDLKALANFVYERIFLGYTLKQWGLRPEELDPSVTGRVPILVSFDDRYFQDTYQAMPEDGYTAMVRRMLTHKNIHVLLGTDWAEVKDQITAGAIIFTGPLDEFFGYQRGVLPYRSLSFRYQHLMTRSYQKVAQVNFPNLNDYTRIIEFKHLTGQTYLPHTTIAFEYPEPFELGKNDPYYPVPSPESAKLRAEYLRDAEKLKGVHFAGRLGDYRYYNMDQAVSRALQIFQDLARGKLPRDK